MLSLCIIAVCLLLPKTYSLIPLRSQSTRASLALSGIFNRKGGEAAADTADVTAAPPLEVEVASVGGGNHDWIEWEVFVDQSKSSLDRGGSATLDAMFGLANKSIQVIPCTLKSKQKGPVVRCVAVNQNKRDSFDVGNVDSVDKVHRVLTKHMQVKNVSSRSCDCLKWKYKGNGHVEAGETSLAIEAYNKALETGAEQQEGIVLLMRSAAHFQSATGHKQALQTIVNGLLESVPTTEQLKTLLDQAEVDASIANAIFRRVLDDTSKQEGQFRKIQYRHGLYQWCLLQAAQDALRATELLPQYSMAWSRAGDVLSELWKLEESTQYYERAILLDQDLQAELEPVIERLRKRQTLLDNAREFGWADDTLRLALDVAG